MSIIFRIRIIWTIIDVIIILNLLWYVSSLIVSTTSSTSRGVTILIIIRTLVVVSTSRSIVYVFYLFTTLNSVMITSTASPGRSVVIIVRGSPCILIISASLPSECSSILLPISSLAGCWFTFISVICTVFFKVVDLILGNSSLICLI